MSKTKKKLSKKKYLAKKNAKYKALKNTRTLGLDEENTWLDGERYRLITSKDLAGKVHSTHYVRNWLDIIRNGKFSNMISTMSDVQRGQWIPNYKENYDYCKYSEKIDYCEQAEKPCFILLPGPSLAKNVHELKKIKDRSKVTIIAASGAIKLFPDPDYYVVVDYMGDTGWLKGIDTSEITGVFAYFTAPHIVQKEWKRRVLFNTMLKNELSIEVERDHPHLLRMEQGMHTGYSAFFLSFILGCNPITFVGADYSWEDDKKMHAVDHEQKWTEEVRPGESFELPGIDGKLWRSRMDYVKFMLHIRAGAYFLANEGFEKTGQINTRVINATEGGILQYPPYIQQMKLSEVVRLINEEPVEREKNG